MQYEDVLEEDEIVFPAPTEENMDETCTLALRTWKFLEEKDHDIDGSTTGHEFRKEIDIDTLTDGLELTLDEEMAALTVGVMLYDSEYSHVLENGHTAVWEPHL